MIPCRLTTYETDCDCRGWLLHGCARCGKTWYMAGHHSTWKGDLVLCKAWPDWWELGHWLGLTLAAVGITKARYLALKHTVGLNPKCGCDGRIESVNTTGLAAAGWLTALWKFLMRKHD